MAQKSECIRYKPSLSFQNEPASFPVFPLEKGEFSETWKSLSPNISNQLANPEDLFPYRSLTCPISMLTQGHFFVQTTLTPL